MQMKNALKMLVLALPIATVIGCSSGKNKGDQAADSSNSWKNGFLNGGADKEGSEEQARLQIQSLQRNNIVYFGLDKYDVQSEYAQLLEQHAAFLRSHPQYKVTIEGHADERGTPEYNIALGERRANAVKMYLQGKGVADEQISIVSYGKEKPAELGHSQDAYAKNRRAVIVY